MTQLFIFSEKESVRMLEFSETPEAIVNAINRGEWQHYLGYEPVPTQAWQALRVGRRVIVTNPTDAVEYPDLKLIPREIQVLQSLSAGFTTQQTAWNLHIDVRTVHSHTAHARAKLHAKTTAQMIAYAVALGLVQPELDNMIV